MTNRWSILALLFCARVTMAFQYQAAAALSPFVMRNYGVGLADIGLLIGFYLSPGILIAFPGAAIGKRFGDKQTVSFGLLLMLLGGLVVAFVPTWEAQIAGRVFAGVGGVILNVLMTKMVTDWFAGPKLATAMGIFVNSWPVGIAGALLVLPYFAEHIGLTLTMVLIAILIGISHVSLLALYRSPDFSNDHVDAITSKLNRFTLTCVLVAAAIWGLFNGAIVMIFGFGPAMLAEQGWSTSTASSTTSLSLWLLAVSAPLGGIIADRINNRDLVLVLGLGAFASLMFMTLNTEHKVLIFAVLGFVAGIAVGPIMSLPADVLLPENRSCGMGIFFTLYYVTIFITPVIAGNLSEMKGTAEVTFAFGGILLLVCLFLLVLFKLLVRRVNTNTMSEQTANIR